MKRNGQSAIEFVLLVSFMLIIFFIFFLAIQSRIADGVKAQDVQFLKEANNIVVSEVKLAQAAQPDFSHTFRLQEVYGKTYNIRLTDEYEVTSSYNDVEYVNFLPTKVVGQLFSDFSRKNTIYKLDGIWENPTTEQLLYEEEYQGVFLNVNPERCRHEDILNGCASLSPLEKSSCITFFGLC